MARIIGYYLADAELSAAEYVTDYSEEGLARLAEAEAEGCVLRAVYDDGTEEQVTSGEVTDPSAPATEIASLGVSYSTPSARGLKAQSDPAANGWTGMVEMGGIALRFEDGLLVAVTQQKEER